MKKNLVLFIIMGCMYLLIEVFFRAFYNLIFKHDFSLLGNSSIYMLFIGGISAFIIGEFNEFIIEDKDDEFTYGKRMFNTREQCIYGTMIILFFEFISGIILNIVFKFNIWNYSDLPFSLLGQINLLFGLFWFLLCPVCIWVDDVLRYVLYDELQPDCLLNIYKELIFGDKI